MQEKSIIKRTGLLIFALFLIFSFNASSFADGRGHHGESHKDKDEKHWKDKEKDCEGDFKDDIGDPPWEICFPPPPPFGLYDMLMQKFSDEPEETDKSSGSPLDFLLPALLGKSSEPPPSPDNSELMAQVLPIIADLMAPPSPSPQPANDTLTQLLPVILELARETPSPSPSPSIDQGQLLAQILPLILESSRQTPSPPPPPPPPIEIKLSPDKSHADKGTKELMEKVTGAVKDVKDTVEDLKLSRDVESKRRLSGESSDKEDIEAKNKGNSKDEIGSTHPSHFNLLDDDAKASASPSANSVSDEDTKALKALSEKVTEVNEFIQKFRELTK